MAEASQTDLVAFTGRCIAFQRLGAKCLFADIHVTNEEAAPAEDAHSSAPARGPVIHLAGDHVPRDVALRVREPVAGDTVWSVFCGLKESSLGPAEFAALSESLGTPGELSKPRIGDLFRVSGSLVPDRSQCVNGIQLGRVDARSATVLQRGPVARPGDFSEKWRLKASAQSAPRRPPVAGGKRDQPRRTRNRFACMAALVFEHTPPRDDGESMRFVDVAGGSAKLAVELTSADRGGHKCTVVDPRPAPAMPTSSSVTFVADLLDAQVHAEHLREANAIIGLHCDGAVNELVKAACAYNVAFFICPCCVFPKTYARSLQSGDSVTTREQLVDWILEQAKAAGYEGNLFKTRLSFDGANLVAAGVPVAH
uniref:Uncharacterized protein n=1 Tax=Neobodo designis TaxID=312471 RepID=A0A7S1MIP0_NEODS|mmetsp:Transcript_41307/g.127622  ORF Transcript_41307/g.127622 Transcript_41307/m.127622 type:complete len:368 (+) Transcript_41307:25-1128(+)|eukprot:CAMPEP_0174855960 /NCGR_PEP_ID=MMETSP1114-20130205/34686_1 /TAXON_ID=312471 /ORGANISM="Neobodo designis, Strain CCAP 1951/1" /LENGTH=367 /DNA_ID=CAMNT_0016090735 /DNA_START=25 /DNA_END=1128 /DNA_ORIENTATION=+